MVREPGRPGNNVLHPIDPPVRGVNDSAARWLQPGWEFRQRTRPSRAPKPVVPPRFIVLEDNDALAMLVSRYMDDAETIHVTSLEGARAEFDRAPAQALLINNASVGTTLQHVYDSHTLPAGLPAVVCTIAGSQEAASELGLSGYLMKPVSQEHLIQAIDRLNLKGRTILVVDDETDAQQLFHRMLASSKREYRVLRAGSGREALTILRSQRVHAILLDMVMPDMDGLQFLGEFSRDSEICHTPVVAVTGRDPAGHAVVSSSLGVTRADGLTVPQVLSCIQAISEILSAVQARDPAPPVAQAG